MRQSLRHGRREAERIDAMQLNDWGRELESDESYRRAAIELRPFLDLADAILAARLARGWSQADLADRAGTKQANISRIESGLANPTVKLLQKLADALDTELVLHLHAWKSDRVAETPAPYLVEDEIGKGSAMTQMIRKQIYIERRQQALLARLAASRGVSEAEVIRQAIERETAGGLAQHPLPDATALDELVQAALQRREAGVTGQPLQWRREDAYAGRLDHYRRLDAEDEGL
jgi:transcriptional regulator with XRE-family HTH domain